MKVKCPYCKIRGPRYSGEDCMGNEVKYTCKHCKGTGEIEEEDIKIEYKIPPGVHKFKMLDGYFEMGDSEYSIPQLILRVALLKEGSDFAVEKKLILKMRDSAWRYEEDE